MPRQVNGPWVCLLMGSGLKRAGYESVDGLCDIGTRAICDIKRTPHRDNIVAGLVHGCSCGYCLVAVESNGLSDPASSTAHRSGGKPSISP